MPKRTKQPAVPTMEGTAPPPSRAAMRKVNVPAAERGPRYRLASGLPEEPPAGMSVEEVIALLEPHLRPERCARLAGVAAQRMESLTVVLEGLYDPGNRSAVYRTAESFGVLDLHVVNPAAAKKPHARAVSRGAEKWTRIHEWAWPEDAVRSLRARGFLVAASDLQAEVALHEVSFEQPVALVFGNEHDGITEEMRELADVRFVVPMRGFTESLNISTAAAVCIAHARAARERALGALTDLDMQQVRRLHAAYLRRAVRASGDILGVGPQ
ncbi:MAG: TrmH family RNA methyltransferase [Deltaproteobacteria bacterium]|nr:MAG: TrmH family RNA methyltransferase [Deltaproteobacteria bacterium]